MWQNKVILLTGASSGIGFKLACELVRRGSIVVALARSEDKLVVLAQQFGERCVPITCDVTQEREIEGAVQATLSRFGRIDLLVNNAGFGQFGSVSELSTTAFEAMMNVNYMGVVRCTKAVLPAMLQQGSGHIVNVVSLAGKMPSARSAAYTASKHATLGFSNCLRMELQGTGIHVTNINPGPVDTPFFERADPSGRYVQNVRFMMLTAEQVVSATIRGVERNTYEVNIPWIASLGVKLYQWMPSILDGVARRMMNRK